MPKQTQCQKIIKVIKQSGAKGITALEIIKKTCVPNYTARISEINRTATKEQLIYCEKSDRLYKYFWHGSR